MKFEHIPTPHCTECGEPMYEVENSLSSDATLRYRCSKDGEEAVWIPARTAGDHAGWERTRAWRNPSATA